METISVDEPHTIEGCYRQLFERNPVPMWVCDAKTLRLLDVNAAACSLYGYSKQEFLALTLLHLCHGQNAAQLREYIELPASQQTSTRPWRHKHRSGDLMEVGMVTDKIEFDGIRAHMTVIHDMAAQRGAEQAQRELAHRLVTTLENITDSFLTLDLDWRFTYVNARAEKMLGRTREELLGFSVWDLYPEDAGGVFQTECERALAEGGTRHFETYYEPLGLWLEIVVYPSASGLGVYFRDVTEMHVVRQRLLAERETLNAVINTTTDAIISVDTEGRIMMFNTGAERIFRRTRESMLGQNMEVLLPERFRAAHSQHLHNFAYSMNTTRMMGLGLVKGLRSDAQEIDLEGTISRVVIDQQQLLVTCLKDVTERFRLDTEVKQSRQQLSDLTQSLMAQEKIVVKRLAQVLHDQLGQTMAAIRMAHETIVTLQKDKLPAGVDRLQSQLGSLISQAVRQVRQVLVDLRPPLLEEQGLSAALDNELRNRSLTQPQIDISIYVQPEVALMRWPGEVEYAAFMVAREAVENALRHSGGSAVSVSLSGTATAMQLEVNDNGVGLAAGATPTVGHLGILGMQERARVVGATLTVHPGTAQGMHVSFSWRPSPSSAP